MPHLRLYLDDLKLNLVYRFVRPDGSVGEIPYLRLIAYANLFKQLLRVPRAARLGITKCIIDTGSPISIIPENFWRFFRPGVVTWLAFHPSTPASHRRVVVAGGAFPFDLGEITLHLEDQDHNHLDVTFVAKFTRDGGALTTPPTLGLRGGFLDGRVLHAEPDPAAPHGQGWVLQAP